MTAGRSARSGHTSVGQPPAQPGLIGAPAARAILVNICGLPGTGKTTLARAIASHLGAPLLAKDRFQAALRSRGLAARKTADGYYLLLDQADEQLSLGLSVVLDGVFPQAEFRQAAHNLARRHGAGFRPVHCICSDRSLWQRRMEGRVATVPGWTPVGWVEVRRLESQYEPWEPAAALVVDAALPWEECLAAALAYVRVSGREEA